MVLLQTTKLFHRRCFNVSPIEIIPMADGELASNPNDVKSSGIDKDGNSYQSNITNDNVIECTCYRLELIA